MLFLLVLAMQGMEATRVNSHSAVCLNKEGLNAFSSVKRACPYQGHYPSQKHQVHSPLSSFCCSCARKISTSNLFATGCGFFLNSSSYMRKEMRFKIRPYGHTATSLSEEAQKYVQFSQMGVSPSRLLSWKKLTPAHLFSLLY